MKIIPAPSKTKIGAEKEPGTPRKGKIIIRLPKIVMRVLFDIILNSYHYTTKTDNCQTIMTTNSPLVFCLLTSNIFNISSGVPDITSS